MNHGHQGPVDDTDEGQRQEPGHQILGAIGDDGQQKTHEAVGAHLQQNARQDHGTRRGGLHVGVRQPGVKREHRHLDGEGQEECQGQQVLEGLGLLGDHRRHGLEGFKRKVVGVIRFVLQEVDGEDRHEHQHRAGQGVKEELDGGIQLLRTAPDTDEEVHGHQHHFPEDVKQEHVLGDEDGEHGGLEYQKPDVVFLPPLLDVAPGAEHSNGAGEGGQEPEQQGNAIHPDAEFDAEARHPIAGVGELHRGTTPVVLEPKRHAQQKAGDHDGHRRLLKDLPLLVRHEEQADTPQ